MWRGIMRKFDLRYFKFNFDSMEKFAASHLKLFLSMMGVLVVFVGIVAIAIFFVAVRGAEQTMVPEVRGKNLPRPCWNCR